MAKSKKRTSRGKTKKPNYPVEQKKDKGLRGVLLAFLAGGTVIAVLFFAFGGNFKHTEISHVETSNSTPAKSSEIRTLSQLLTLTPEELEKVNIGLMNLICAKGLPGAENLDIDKCLQTLDEWAEFVRIDTEKRIWNFTENPAKYDYSEGKCRMVNLGLTLREDKGVHYNMNNLKEVDFSDCREIFINGPLTNTNHGSCTNLPVLGASIARRLGYPVKLVPTIQHLFLRWDDDKAGERFNIELATDGVGLPDDEHYMNWPQKLNELDQLRDYYLKSMNATETLAAFLDLRGDVLMDSGRVAEAQVAYAQAYSLMPNKMIHLLDLASTVDRELERMARKDYNTVGKRVVYTVCPSMDEKDLKKAWRYRYPK